MYAHTLMHTYTHTQDWFLTSRNFPKPVVDLK